MVPGAQSSGLNVTESARSWLHVLAAVEEFSGERPTDERMHEPLPRHSLKPLFV
jgi:hypothetical protein